VVHDNLLSTLAERGKGIGMQYTVKVVGQTPAVQLPVGPHTLTDAMAEVTELARRQTGTQPFSAYVTAVGARGQYLPGEG
jgi:hypothetical protein